MAWLILGIAVVTEIVWALSLKWAAMQASLAGSASSAGRNAARP